MSPGDFFFLFFPSSESTMHRTGKTAVSCVATSAHGTTEMLICKLTRIWWGGGNCSTGSAHWLVSGKRVSSSIARSTIWGHSNPVVATLSVPFSMGAHLSSYCVFF